MAFLACHHSWPVGHGLFGLTEKNVTEDMRTNTLSKIIKIKKSSHKKCILNNNIYLAENPKKNRKKNIYHNPKNL